MYRFYLSETYLWSYHDEGLIYETLNMLNAVDSLKDEILMFRLFLSPFIRSNKYLNAVDNSYILHISNISNKYFSISFPLKA